MTKVFHNMPKIKAQYLGNSDVPKELVLHLFALRKETRHKASQYLRTARARAARLKAKSREAGYLHGLELAELESSKALIKKTIELQDYFKKIIAKANTECLTLAISIAERVLETEIRTNPGPLLKKIDTVLGKLSKLFRLTVLVNQKDLDQIRNALGARHLDIEIDADPEIESGCALIKTNSGSIEISWRNHLEQLAEALSDDLTKMIPSLTNNAVPK